MIFTSFLVLSSMFSTQFSNIIENILSKVLSFGCFVSFKASVTSVFPFEREFLINMAQAVTLDFKSILLYASHS